MHPCATTGLLGKKGSRRQGLNNTAANAATLAETKMRSADFSIYERKLERRSEMLEEIAERKRKEEAMRLAAIEARKEAIRKEIADAAANLRRAQDIRSLVEAMAGHPDCVGEQSANYLIWSDAALAEADAIDPMLQPFNKCFSAWDSTGGDSTT